MGSIQAFDTGPCNMMLDGLSSELSGGKRAMDRGGSWAAKGTVHATVIERLLGHPFLRRRPPKSTGREEFGQDFLFHLLALARRRRLKAEDLLATCTCFAALSVAGARRWLKGPVDEVVVGGGGAFNRALMRDLATAFAPARVRSFATLGWPAKAFEAAAFAILAFQTIRGKPANVPTATGAKRPVLLGKIVPGTGRSSVVWFSGKQR